MGAWGGHFLRDVSCEIDIFKVPTLQDFDKFWTKKGAKMGAKLSIDFALKFEAILKRESRFGKINNFIKLSKFR